MNKKNKNSKLKNKQETKSNKTNEELPTSNLSDNQDKNHEEEITKLRDEKLRLLAEMENLRKRFEKEKIDSIKFGSINLARDILSPNDNLTRALENIPDNEKLDEKIKNLIEGLRMVKKEFTKILEKHGIKEIETIDKKFDHNLHQAMFEIETDKEEGIVVKEIQTGYTMYHRLLRPAMVGISKKPKKKSEKK